MVYKICRCHGDSSLAAFAPALGPMGTRSSVLLAMKDGSENFANQLDKLRP